MADVNIQQTPPAGDTGRGNGAVWAVVVVILLLVIAWFVFGGGMRRTTNVNINTPASGAPAGGSGGSGAPPGGTKTP